MLSILVCSVKPFLLDQLRKNVDETVGIEFEILAYDNRTSKKGICEVYNLLAAKAQYEIVCFVHEDVLFLTKDWGKILAELFFYNNVGAVGVAGSKYKSSKFSGWFTGQKEYDCANILHRSKLGDEKMYLHPTHRTEIEEVVCLDGVFISCLRSLWLQIKFDEKNLKGFHLYDLDFSLRVAMEKTVVVIYNISLAHLTEGGDFSDEWLETAIQFHIRNATVLPFSIVDLPASSVELEIVKATLDVLKNYSISLVNKCRWVTLQKLHLHPRLFYSIIKFLLYRPLKLKYVHRLFKLMLRRSY